MIEGLRFFDRLTELDLKQTIFNRATDMAMKSGYSHKTHYYSLFDGPPARYIDISVMKDRAVANIDIYEGIEDQNGKYFQYMLTPYRMLGASIIRHFPRVKNNLEVTAFAVEWPYNHLRSFEDRASEKIMKEDTDTVSQAVEPALHYELVDKQELLELIAQLDNNSWELFASDGD